MIRRCESVSQVTLQTNAGSGRAQREAVRFVTIAAGDALLIHAALQERSPDIHLIEDLPVRVIQRWLWKRGYVGVEEVVPRPVKILVAQGGIIHWIGGTDFATATVFPLAAGEVTSGIRFETCGLTVTSTDPLKTFDHVTIELYDAAESTEAISETYSSGSLHTLGLSNLLPGSYRVRIQPSRGSCRWLPQWFDGATAFDEAETITIGAPGEIVPLAVELEAGGVIRGTIRAPPEDRQETFWLLVTSAAAPSDCWTSLRNNRVVRDFEIFGLPDGDWKIGVTRRHLFGGCPDSLPGDMRWYPGTPDWEAATAIEIRDHAEIGGIELPAPEE